jgi:RNA polymerase sigma-70 factor (ECF subfamily)
LPDSSDAELVERAQGGDVAAVGELYDLYHQDFFRFAWSRLGHRQAAEDLTGELFTRMVKNLGSYRTRDVPFRAWLYRIARNLVVDYYRKHGRYEQVSIEQYEGTIQLLSEDGRSPYPESAVEKQLTLDRVRRALESIDETQREVVALRFLVGLSLKETADTLQKSVPAVKSLQYRGLAALRTATSEVLLPKSESSVRP